MNIRDYANCVAEIHKRNQNLVVFPGLRLRTANCGLKTAPGN